MSVPRSDRPRWRDAAVSGLRVLSEPCGGCPFKGRINLGSGRLRDIIESCERDNRYFICHQLAYYPDSTRRRPKRFEAVCAGWLDAARRRRYGPPAIMQIAERLDVVVLVEPPS
jgi:hypothetical protein